MADDSGLKVDAVADDGVSRRGFVDWILGSSVAGFVAAVFYPVVRYIFPPASAESVVNTVTLPFPASELPAGSGRIFRFGDRPAIAVRTQSGEIRAFSARCTHLDCTVQFRDDLGLIWCACHNGQFDLNGRNIAGPPPRPLDAYDVRLRGDQVIVTRPS